MNVIFPRFVKSAYRREPIISVLITMGILDAVIGGFNDSWSLFVIGLGTAGATLAYRLWRVQQRPPYLKNLSYSTTYPIAPQVLPYPC